MGSFCNAQHLLWIEPMKAARNDRKIKLELTYGIEVPGVFDYCMCAGCCLLMCLSSNLLNIVHLSSAACKTEELLAKHAPSTGNN